MYLSYKGYKGKFTKEEDCGYCGRVENSYDIITFQGKTLMELWKALVDSLEDYFEWCKELGEEPR